MMSPTPGWNMEQNGRVSNLVVSMQVLEYYEYCMQRLKTHPTQSPASCLFRIEGNFCFREKVKSQSSLSLARLTLAKSTLEICASTALDKIRIYAVHAHVCQEFVTICITCLHTSIFFYAPRTYLSTYLFTYKIYIVLLHLVALCCMALIAVLE